MAVSSRGPTLFYHYLKLLKLSSKLGDVAEFLFDAMAVKNGFIVNRPIHSGTVYDRILDNGQKFFRVQIKSIWEAAKHRNKYRAYLRRDNNKRYLANQVDVFAVYVKEVDRWYIVPTPCKANLSLTDLYKENWKYFEAV